jgi:capsular polysaccharide biosynthesis protein
MLLFLGVVGTIGGAVGIAVLLELFDPVVLDEPQLERIVELPVLGSLPEIEEPA